MKSVLYFLLRILVIYHLIIILLIPNRESWLNQSMSWLFLPYANQLQLNIGWQFFSPDPGPATFLVANVKKESETIATIELPPSQDEWFWRSRMNRRIAAMRFIGRDNDRIKQIWFAYLCRKYPEASHVAFEKNVAAVPGLAEVKLGEPLNSFSAVSSDYLFSEDCPRLEGNE